MAALVNTIARSKYWGESAIVVTWDDPGGYWDHVPPPKWLVCPDGHVCGNGQRVPLLLISPFARTGVVHEYDDQASVIKFVEHLFDRTPLAQLPDEARYMPFGPRDANAETGDLAGGFDPARLSGDSRTDSGGIGDRPRRRRALDSQHVVVCVDRRAAGAPARRNLRRAAAGFQPARARGADARPLTNGARKMKRYRLLGFVAAASLAGCAGAQPPSLTNALPLATDHVTAAHRSGSWMLPEAKAQTLLYSADFEVVDVYTYPKGKLVGQLTGFQELAGLCSDRAGNVYAVNSADFQLLEYAHGGTSPIATISNGRQYPFSCAVDWKTGQLAVSNFGTTSSRYYTLSIFAAPSAAPQYYDDPAVAEAYYIGYGPHGHIFFDGISSRSSAVYAEFYDGKFKSITVRGGVVRTLLGLQYADGSLTIAGGNYSQSGNAYIYRLTDRGKVTGATGLNAAMTCAGYEIWKNSLICPTGKGNVSIYRYPAGGDPVDVIDPNQSFQVTISVAPGGTTIR